MTRLITRKILAVILGIMLLTLSLAVFSIPAVAAGAKSYHPMVAAAGSSL